MERKTSEESHRRAMQLTIEEALQFVGGAHRYQIMAYIFFCLQWILTGCLLMSPIFLFEHPEFDCTKAGPDKHNLISSECEKWACTQSNFKYYLKTTQFNSFVLSFDPPLICENQWISDTVVALIYGGTVIGFLVSIYLSDKFGRRITSIIFWTLAGVGCVMAGIFESSVWGAAIGLSLANAGMNPTITIHFCFVNEHSDGKFREYTSASLNMFYSFGTLYLVLARQLSSSWTQIAIFWIGVPTLLLSLYYHFIYEPPLFLISKDDYSRAVKTLNRIAKVNKQPSLKIDDLIQNSSSSSNAKGTSSKNNTIANYTDLFRYKSARILLLNASLAFFSIQITYYGINQSLSLVALETKYNAIAVAISELIAAGLIIILIPSMRRRKWSMIATVTCGLVLCGFFFVNKPADCTDFCTETIIQIILVSVAKFIISFLLSLMFVYFSELLPTTIRSLGLGFSQAIAQIGSSMSGYLVTFFQSRDLSPIGFMGLICISSVLVYWPLEETYQKPLNNEISEILEIKSAQSLEMQMTTSTISES